MGRWISRENALNGILRNPLDSQGPSAGIPAVLLQMDPAGRILPRVRTTLLPGKSYPATCPDVPEPVLEMSWERSYPRITGKGKEKLHYDEHHEEHNPENVEAMMDYARTKNPRSSGLAYDRLAAKPDTGQTFVPDSRARESLLYDGSLYYPIILMLDSEAGSEDDCTWQNVPPRGPGEGSSHDGEFDLEREQSLAHLNARGRPKSVGTEGPPKDEGIECGCCFSEHPFDEMFQCAEAHLFCGDCCSRYASELLGSRNPNITCMDQSGCKAPFLESEITRFLPEKLLALYHRIMQEKEIELACLEGLEECPFCEYKVVIENADWIMFYCENDGCRKVSCRECKKEDHWPKTCQEAEEEKHLDGRHAIEEAMTAALMRNCPKCQKAFIKQDGCNKMRCPNCSTLSCYVCRQVISGYDHFGEQTIDRRAVDKTKCPLWESVEERHNDEVAAAAKKAIEEYRKTNPEVDDEWIFVDLPGAPPRPHAPPRPYARPKAPEVKPRQASRRHAVYFRDGQFLDPWNPPTINAIANQRQQNLSQDRLRALVQEPDVGQLAPHIALVRSALRNVGRI